MRSLTALLLTACLASAPAFALDAIPVAPGVYAFLADTGEPSVDNGANTGNSGFIVGADGVIVVDTGISYRHGEAMLAAIARVTEKPVRLAIVTHGMQEFLFGNAAFAERGVPLLAHVKTVELMRSRCEHCLENLHKLLGAERMRGTRVVLPERTVDGSTPLRVAGRTLELLHYGWAATPGDLAVLDRYSGVLFAGGLVSVRRIPELRDGRIDGWLEALDRLGRLDARILVPGHGAPAGPAAIGEMRAYLLALEAQARALYDAGASLMEAVDGADLFGYRDWAMYPATHRKNVQQRYLELEVGELERR
jgi:glyoxylase-like metal-dependent hydrolase (beta-lactamase superfamily II)